MRKFKPFLLLIFMGVYSQMVFSQTTSRLHADTIPNSLLSHGFEDVYAEKIKLCGNGELPNLITMLYLTKGDDSFCIKQYYGVDNESFKSTHFLVKNAFDIEMLNNGYNHSIKNIYAKGQKLYVYYSEFITIITFNEFFNELKSVEHIKLRTSLKHNYEYLIPLQDSSNYYLGLLQRFFEHCPLVPEVSLCPRIIEHKGDTLQVAEEHICLDNFEDYFWPYIGFTPFHLSSKGLYAINALSHNLYFFSLQSKSWEEISVIGADHLMNNINCIDSIKTATKNNRHALYNGCYPRNFYYKFLFANSSTLYLLRNYIEKDSICYYIDEYKIDSSHRVVFKESIELSSMKTIYNDIEMAKWTSTELLLSPLFINEKYFSRIIPVQVDKESKVLLFEIYSTTNKQH